jgi:hypothetical protein
MSHNFSNNIFHPQTHELLYTKCTQCDGRGDDQAVRDATCPSVFLSDISIILINGKEQPFHISIQSPIDRHELEEVIKTKWHQYEVTKFALLHENVMLSGAKFKLPNGATIKIQSLCKAFSDFKNDEPRALKYAEIKSIDIKDDIFLESVIYLEAEINIIVQELQRKADVFDLYQASEYTMREFISPLLVSALVSTSDVKMVAEKNISGSLGNGPVDYTLIYKDFNICVVEAKKEAIHQGVLQNVAQLVASREDYCNRNKRKIDDIVDLPSSGIVTTGEEWIFIRYTKENGEWKIYRSNILHIHLDDVRHSNVVAVWKRIIGMIEFEQNAIDNLQLFLM